MKQKFPPYVRGFLLSLTDDELPFLRSNLKKLLIDEDLITAVRFDELLCRRGTQEPKHLGRARLGKIADENYLDGIVAKLSASRA